MAIRGENALAAGKSAHQHQQARLRQMKIGQQRANKPERKAGRNENLCLARVRLQFPALGAARNRLKRAHNCCAHRNNPPALALYGSLGYAVIYDYHYCKAPRP